MIQRETASSRRNASCRGVSRCFQSCLRDSRKRQKVDFSFAGLPQAPKTTFFHLRDSRKRQKLLFSICGTSANAKNFFFPFAGLPQALKCSFFICGTSASIKMFIFHLRNFRKRQKLLFLICGNPADNKKFIFPSAGLPQAPKITSPPSRSLRRGTAPKRCALAIGY